MNNENLYIIDLLERVNNDVITLNEAYLMALPYYEVLNHLCVYNIINRSNRFIMTNVPNKFHQYVGQLPKNSILENHRNMILIFPRGE